MKRKYKLKKSAIIIISIILLGVIVLTLFIISLFKTKSYSIEYNLDDYKISEYYDDKNKLFYYEINKDDITYNFIHDSKYTKERKMINKINTFKEDNVTCITIESEQIKFNPLCNIESELVDYRLVPSTLLKKMNIEINNNEEEKEINNYTIYDNDFNAFIWNYKGFNHIKNKESNFISLFEKDFYNIPLTTKINNYLIIPDYEQEYTFNKVYIIDLNTNEVDTWTLKSNISYDSYILGTNKKSLYIIDQKNKREYELVPHKKKMRVLATSNKQGIIYNNGEEKKISMKTLISEKHSFTYKTKYKYKLIDNKLYLSYLDKGTSTKVSNQNISKIISIKEDTIYYLVNTTLYKYSLEEGEKKLASYSEWEFNSDNVIFIND